MLYRQGNKILWYGDNKLSPIQGGITCLPKVDHPPLYNKVLSYVEDNNVICALMANLIHKQEQDNNCHHL